MRPCELRPFDDLFEFSEPVLTGQAHGSDGPLLPAPPVIAFMLAYKKQRGLHWFGPPELRWALLLKCALSFAPGWGVVRPPTRPQLRLPLRSQ